MVRHSLLRIIFVSLLLAVTGCGITGSGQANPLTGNQAIIDALLQPQDLPFMWRMIENSKSQQVYKCEGAGYMRGFAPTLTRGRDIGPDIVVFHTIYECKNTSAARARFDESRYPNPNFIDPITRFAGGKTPPNVDAFSAFCGSFRNGSTVCTTIAQYGRIVSVIEVSSKLDRTVFPTTFDILRWTVDRNDKLLSKFSK